MSDLPTRSRILHKGIYLIVFTLLPWVGTCQSITFFDIIPDLGGLNNQGQALIILPDTNEIYVIGDLIDVTSTPYDTVIRPFIARFDYGGHMQMMNILYDSTAPGPYHIITRPIIKEDSSIYLYAEQVNASGNFQAAMIELDSYSGSILRSKTFPHPPTIDSSHTPWWYYKDLNDHFITYHYLWPEKRIYIRTIDTSFKVVSEFLVEENGRWNLPMFINKESDSTYILIGSSIAPPGGPFPEAKFFFMRINESGKIKNFNLAPGITNKTVGFSAGNSYTVLKNQNNDWIISGRITELLDKPSTYNVIPISFSVTPEFDSLLWISYFAEVPYDSTQHYILTSSCWANDQSGFVVSGFDFDLKDRNSFLVKISPDGDSLWTRHYIPLGWDQDRLSWADVEDVKATPHNTFVLAGVVFDRDLGIRRPWILHVDSMGCLIPGCDRIVSTFEPGQTPPVDFVIYPNPASDQLYILYQGADRTSASFKISLLTSSGQVLQSTALQATPQGQYILPLSEIPSGQYYISIENKGLSYLQSEKIIKF